MKNIEDYQKLENGTIIRFCGHEYLIYMVNRVPDDYMFDISVSANKVLKTLPDVYAWLKVKAFRVDDYNISNYLDVYKMDFGIKGKIEDSITLKLQMLGYLEKENLDYSYMHLKENVNYKLEMMPQSYYSYANEREMFYPYVDLNSNFSLGLKIVGTKVQVSVLYTDEVLTKFWVDLNQPNGEFEKEISLLCKYNTFQKGFITTYEPKEAKGKIVKLTEKEFISRYLNLNPIGIKAFKTLKKEDFYNLMYPYVSYLNKDQKWITINLAVNLFKIEKENRQLVDKIYSYLKPNGRKHFSVDCLPEQVPMLTMYTETATTYKYSTMFGQKSWYEVPKEDYYENWLKKMFNDKTAVRVAKWSLECQLNELDMMEKHIF